VYDVSRPACALSYLNTKAKTVQNAHIPTGGTGPDFLGDHLGGCANEIASHDTVTTAWRAILYNVSLSLAAHPPDSNYDLRSLRIEARAEEGVPCVIRIATATTRLRAFGCSGSPLILLPEPAILHGRNVSPAHTSSSLSCSRSVGFRSYADWRAACGRPLVIP